MSEFKKKLHSMAEALFSPDNELTVWAEENGNEELLAYAAFVQAKAAKAIKDVIRLADTKTNFDLSIEADSIHPRDLEELAEVAAQFDDSDDPFLQKQAAVIDQLLINFAQRGLRAEAESADEKELAKLRAEYRAKASEKCYEEPRKVHEKDIKAADAVKAIRSQVKEYRPMETALSTRYCPDHPGNQVRRVGDYTYQCGLDKKVYNYQEGFTTEKGNKVPGSDVARQTQYLGDRALEEMHFSTREARLGNNQ
tara:strand:- start:144 stop:902 length:759 start_codon:yes stop_codon:yes gene_type:complete